MCVAYNIINNYLNLTKIPEIFVRDIGKVYPLSTLKHVKNHVMC